MRLVLAVAGTADGIVVRRGRLRDRLAARLRAGALDRELARGAAPDSRAPLALRAHALIGPAARAALAHQVHRVVDHALHGGARRRSQIPTRRDEVIAAAPQLRAIAGRLLAPDPVSARGVARVRLLLSDGNGPLYFSGAGEPLPTVAARALDELDEV
jgi:hypothetical protein